ncbi:phage portal protein, partial [Nocardiopsis protaetiae]|uniref:phage portal protein n=1 Tax=Nocardiopsis protaetiae TaxID=3382270 RepID=UPI00387B0B40
GWWQDNDLDDESGMGHLDAMIYGRAFAVVGPADTEGAAPVITVESAESMAADTDPRTGRVRASLRLYDDNEYGLPQKATLYRPNRTVHYQRAIDGRGAAGDWETVDIDVHGFGVTLVVPLVNRPRLGRRHRDGVTEMRNLIDLTNAACRSLTNLQGAQELHALPRNYVLGADQQDFVGPDGNPIPTWEAYIGRLWTLANEDAKVGQLQASDLRNFTETLTLYSRLASGMSGLPPHYFGLISDNPASADAIRAGETRLVKRAERRQRAFGEAWERVMRLALLVAGDDPDAARNLETVWRDPSTPTYAAKADAVTKLFTSGLIPKEAAWEDLGYSEERRQRLRDLDSSDPAVRYLEVLQSAGRAPAPGPSGEPAVEP